MGIRSLSTSSISTGAKRSKVWDQSAVVIPPNSFDSIATVTLGSDTSSISFSSIPTTYTHLQIRMFAGTTFADVFMRFNGDASGNSNYSRHFLYGDGTSAASGNAITDANLSVGYYSTNASIFGSSVVDIFDYNSTNKNKTIRVLSGGDANGSGLIVLYSGSRNLTNAVTSITILAGGSGVLRTNSKFALYGIKG